MSGVQTPLQRCSHDDKGVCDRHGVKGKLRWEPQFKTTPGGGKVKSRLYFYTCDLGLNKKRMIQQKLSFLKHKTTKNVKTTKSDDDTM